MPFDSEKLFFSKMAWLRFIQLDTVRPERLREAKAHTARLNFTGSSKLSDISHRKCWMVHPGKLIWTINMMVLKRMLLSTGYCMLLLVSMSVFAGVTC